MKKTIIIISVIGVIFLVFISVGVSAVIKLSTNKHGSDGAIKEVSAFIEKEEYNKAFEKTAEIMSKKTYDPVKMNELACKLMNKGREEEAIYILSILAERNQNRDEVYNNLSWAYNSLNQYKLANYYVDRSLEILPNSYFEYANKGNAVRGLGNGEAAIKQFDEALKLDPKGSAAVWGKAMCLFDQKKYQDSTVWFKRYAKIKVEDEKSTQHYLVSSYENLGQYENALSVYTEYLQKNPKDENTLTAMGYLMIRGKKDYKGALPYFEKALELSKENAWIYLDVASCQAQLGQNGAAIRNIRKAIDLDDECRYDLPDYTEFTQLKTSPEYKKLFQ